MVNCKERKAIDAVVRKFRSKVLAGRKLTQKLEKDLFCLSQAALLKKSGETSLSEDAHEYLSIAVKNAMPHMCREHVR